MRLLLDECLDGGVVRALREAGYDLVDVREWQPGAADDMVLRNAHEMGRILITLDSDFGRLVYSAGMPHCGVLRIAGFTSDEEAEACLDGLRRFGAELTGGAWVVLESDNYRIRD
jgi:predicted nuclease of predicted toxin-antitoxin system